MPQLRQFSAFSKTAGFSIFAYPCNLTNTDGTYVSGVANQYFQIFDKASAPIANDVPIASFLITAAGPFPLASLFMELGPITLSLGLAVGISTVDFKYTAATATYSVFGEIEEGLQSTDAIPGLTTTGDLTTGIQSQQLWLDGDNSNSTRLFRLRAKNLAGSDRYIMVMSIDQGGIHPINGDAPFLQYKVATGVTITEYYGATGVRPAQFYNALVGSTPYTNRDYFGCIIVVSSTPGILTIAGATDMACESQFKVVSNY